MRKTRWCVVAPAGTLAVLLGTALPAIADQFASACPAATIRTWVGPEYWANRLQDWRIADGRLECVEASQQKPTRAVHLLVAALGSQPGEFSMSVRTGPIEPDATPSAESWSGFLIGSGGEHIDYRLTALTHHRPAEDGGLLAAMDGNGRIIFRDFAAGTPANGGRPLVGDLTTAEQQSAQPLRDVELRLTAEPAGPHYTLTLAAYDPQSGTLISRGTLNNVDAKKLDGGVALVSHRGPSGGRSGYWFRDWKLAGSKVVSHPERANGPVLNALYTLSHGVLKLTAQMPPLGKQDTHTARLLVREETTNLYRTVATARLIEDSYTFPFRVENWDATRDVTYMIVYDLRTGPGTTHTIGWQGKVRAEPDGHAPFVVAAFTGHRVMTGGLKWNHDGIWFPHNELVAAVESHRPDLLFFSGDQIYEGDLTGAQRRPVDAAILDYLDKWYRWCWAFRDLTRSTPSIAIPDDHDVYHGNIWGAGGRNATGPDDGGYVMPARFVNMVQQTQCSHLPDPADPTPVEQGINVYYTSLDYAGLSFAIIEDRKWKSSPTTTIPEGRVVNGWFQNRDFNAAQQADVPDAVLLGDRQLSFLRKWSADWQNGIWMKTVLSQTIFANVATLPAEATSDKVVPRLKRLLPGVYPADDTFAVDADSNGWPQSGRNRALDAMRRGFAFHIAGDQHLGSFVHYGIESWSDSGFGFCVPSIANVWPRRWYPAQSGQNRKEGAPRYTGQFRDGFGNRVQVFAVSNPVVSGREPSALYDRAPGYGIVRFDRQTRDIEIECWPRWVDPTLPDAQQYPGWPITVNQFDNYGRKPHAYLPTIEVHGMSDPVVQVVDESNGETIYTLRIRGESFRPKVFRDGTYTVRVGEPGTPRMKRLENLRAEAEASTSRRVSFD
jgi:phosphodiesterase/alkaline phosphatase D-like protein